MLQQVAAGSACTALGPALVASSVAAHTMAEGFLAAHAGLAAAFVALGAATLAAAGPWAAAAICASRCFTALIDLAAAAAPARAAGVLWVAPAAACR